MIDISVIIVNWNTVNLLRDCIASLYEQTHIVNIEVIVVDNNSVDGSAEMVKREFPEVVVIENAKNVGFAAANNIGLESASGEYILLLNSDTIVLDGALDRTFAYAKAQPQLGVLSCRILNEDYSLQPNCSMFPSLLNEVIFLLGLYRVFARSKFFGRAAMTWWDYKDEREVDVIKGCFMLVRSDALSVVGGMDERFFMYSEEVDWCYRFSKAGWKVGFYSGAAIIHLGGASAAKLGSDRALIKDKSSILYMKKHWSKAQYRIGILMMALFYLSRLPAAWILAVLTKNKRYQKIVANHCAGLKGLLTWESTGGE